MDSRLGSAIIALLLVLLLLGFSNGQTTSRTLTINDWSGSWEYTGFMIGPVSSDYYHLLSNAEVNQCAIIREDTSYNVSWAKLYSNSQCAGITANVSESPIYFVNKDASYLGIYFIDGTNGSAINYARDTTMNVTGGVNTIKGDEYGGLVVLGGNIRNSAGESCTAALSNITSSFLCSASETYEGTFINPIVT